MTILATGFTPFGGETLNPSWEAVRNLPDDVGGCRIIKRLLPTAFGASAHELAEALALHSPDILLSVGQAGGRPDLSIEKVAINYADGVPEDQRGAVSGETIVPGGKDAYFTTLPAKAMVAAIREAGIPAALSFSAGTFVCNYILYTALHLAETRFPGLRCGFVHIPYAPEQVLAKAAPSMPIERATRALMAAVGALCAAEPG